MNVRCAVSASMGLDAWKDREPAALFWTGGGHRQASGDIGGSRGTFRGQLLCLENVIYCSGLWPTT